MLQEIIDSNHLSKKLSKDWHDGDNFSWKNGRLIILMLDDFDLNEKIINIPNSVGKLDQLLTLSIDLNICNINDCIFNLPNLDDLYIGNVSEDKLKEFFDRISKFYTLIDEQETDDEPFEYDVNKWDIEDATRTYKNLDTDTILTVHFNDKDEYEKLRKKYPY